MWSHICTVKYEWGDNLKAISLHGGVCYFLFETSSYITSAVICSNSSIIHLGHKTNASANVSLPFCITNQGIQMVWDWYMILTRNIIVYALTSSTMIHSADQHPLLKSIGVKMSTEYEHGKIIPISSEHWGRDKITVISQTTFSNAFSWMEMYEWWWLDYRRI